MHDRDGSPPGSCSLSLPAEVSQLHCWPSCRRTMACPSSVSARTSRAEQARCAHSHLQNGVHTLSIWAVTCEGELSAHLRPPAPMPVLEPWVPGVLSLRRCVAARPRGGGAKGLVSALSRAGGTSPSNGLASCAAEAKKGFVASIALAVGDSKGLVPGACAAPGAAGDAKGLSVAKGDSGVSTVPLPGLDTPVCPDA